ncbi:MAG: EI24 domain-containing protein [Novosphingobium sp.]
MLTALPLALAQLADPRILWIWFKSLAVTLVLFVVLAAGIWLGTDWVLARAGLNDAALSGGAELRGLAALAAALIGGWLLWRIVALAVLQVFADEVVHAVEVQAYPAMAARARTLGWHEELSRGLAGAGRALLFNLLALPVALVLAVTGVGAPLVFLLVNAVLLGRELQDMVWLRHRPSSQSPMPLSGVERLALGGMVAVLLTVPLVNFVAPFLGAACAVHLIHRKGLPPA